MTMRIPRIYTSQKLSASATITLEEAPSRHIAKVLRMQAGRELVLFNGSGGEYRATIGEVSKKSVQVQLTDFCEQDRQSPLAVELAIGMSRGERMDWVIQKATELGVTAITPLFSERTEVKLSGERLVKKQQHWHQVAISACEQCQRNILPSINPAQQLDDWLSTTEAELKLVLHHRSDKSLQDHRQPQSLALLIGPEGGLSSDEITRAEGKGFQPLTLGPRVLRTETAPLAAISLAQLLWGDF